ncbi:MAG: ATP-dependent DNA helicase RecG, partial [Muribaculaceae bacterium]|nr:ATP-dependent DNA helicase RecG [Muribaculaceae bacterium]
MYLKGVGPQRAELLRKELGVKTVGDLLRHYPSNYVDRSQIYKISDLSGSELPMIQIRGRFISSNIQGEGFKQRLVCLFSDGTGTIEVVWFRGVQSIIKKINPDTVYVLFGKPTEFNRHWQMAHPEMDTEAAAENQKGLRGVYPLTEGLARKNMTSRQIHNLVLSALDGLTGIKDPLPQEVIESQHLMPLAEAFRAIHKPANMIEAERARYRFKFEELFFLDLNIVRYSRHLSHQFMGHRFEREGAFLNEFKKECFPLH